MLFGSGHETQHERCDRRVLVYGVCPGVVTGVVFHEGDTVILAGLSNEEVREEFLIAPFHAQCHRYVSICLKLKSLFSAQAQREDCDRSGRRRRRTAAGDSYRGRWQTPEIGTGRWSSCAGGRQGRACQEYVPNRPVGCNILPCST